MAESKEIDERSSEMKKNGVVNVSSSSSSDEYDESDKETLECAVCLQVCVHPVQLPCGHIFCFLCVKGVANQSKRCAMCRKELPSGYLERPNLVGGTSELFDLNSNAYEDGHQWFYEGHNGWWQYDERTSSELESSFKRGEITCELLIAGFLYVIDFQSMVQFRRNDPSRRRRIKRDLVSIPKKGIAGIRIVDPTPIVTTVAAASASARDATEGGEDDSTAVPSGSGTASSSSVSVLEVRTVVSASNSTRLPKSPSPVPIPPNNTPQTPHTPSQDSGTSSPTTSCDPSFQRIVQDMESLLRESIDIEDDDDDDEGNRVRRTDDSDVEDDERRSDFNDDTD